MSDSVTEVSTSNSVKCISFDLGEHEFCVDIMVVKEIRGWSKPTPLPHSPAFVCGAINLAEALRRIGEGAALMRTKGEAGTGNIVEAVRHLRQINQDIKIDDHKTVGSNKSATNKLIKSTSNTIKNGKFLFRS